MVATGALKGHMAAQTPKGSFVTISVNPIQLKRDFFSILNPFLYDTGGRTIVSRKVVSRLYACPSGIVCDRVLDVSFPP